MHFDNEGEGRRFGEQVMSKIYGTTATLGKANMNSDEELTELKKQFWRRESERRERVLKETRVGDPGVEYMDALVSTCITITLSLMGRPS